jgi:hypothetical protein
VPVRVADRLVMAAAQAARYVRLNGNGRIADQAMDLATEFGAALASTAAGDEAELPVGVLSKLADITESVAVRVEREKWRLRRVSGAVSTPKRLLRRSLRVPRPAARARAPCRFRRPQSRRARTANVFPSARENTKPGISMMAEASCDVGFAH